MATVSAQIRIDADVKAQSMALFQISVRQNSSAN